MLSRSCDGCEEMRQCQTRYKKVAYLEKVYCADGTAHIVDTKQEPREAL